MPNDRVPLKVACVPESSNAGFSSLKTDVPHSSPTSLHVTQAVETAY